MIDPFQSAATWLTKLKSGELSARQATEAIIGRIEQIDPKINAVVVRDFSRARLAADAADNARKRGETLGLLHGLPMTVKEAFDVSGLTTTWGVPEFKNNIADRDSLVVQKLRSAGAIILGKTNIPLMLSDWQTFNDIYGTTNNPWDKARSSGGSSGGAAAALAAGLTPLEVGSDIGASIRSPSHFCGIYGHKPSFGVVPTDGHTFPGLDIELDLLVAGPMARTASDLRLAMQVLAGPSRQNAPAWQIELPERPRQKLSDYRVAVLLAPEICKVDIQVRDVLAKVANALNGKGAKVSEMARPEVDFEAAHHQYLLNLRGATGALMDDTTYADAKENAATLDETDWSYWAYINRAAIQTHREYFAVQQARQALRDAWSAFFKDWDIVLSPIAATTAFLHDQNLPRHERTILVDGVQESYNDQLFWAGLATYPYLPSTVFPAGPAENGLPVGLQAIGPYLHDLETIHFAELLEAEWGGFTPPPGF